MTNHKHTMFGCVAILLWSAVVALLRHVSEEFGPIGGAALIYSVSSLFLLKFVGIPNFRKVSKRYLLVGGVLFVSYEICLALALGFANNRSQAIEMGVINYLWPCFTVLMAIMITRQKVRWFLAPGLLLSLGGIAWTVTDGSIFALEQLSANIQSNPLSYALAFSGAVIWALYCNVTKLMAQKANLITVFFIATAVTLWIKYALSGEAALVFKFSGLLSLVAAGAVMAGGYALWNIGIMGGNMMLLATLSYFIPVFSTFLSAVLLSTTLSVAFWQGVVMVTFGSLICWRATAVKN